MSLATLDDANAKRPFFLAEGFAPTYTSMVIPVSFLLHQTDTASSNVAAPKSGWSDWSPVNKRSLNLPVEVANRLFDLESMPDGWDGNSAPRIKREAVKEVSAVVKELSSCSAIFKAPFIAPTFPGFLQIEWHDNVRSLEFEFTQQEWDVLGVDAVNTDTPRYFSVTVPHADHAALIKLYSWFSQRELIWPISR